MLLLKGRVVFYQMNVVNRNLEAFKLKDTLHTCAWFSAYPFNIRTIVFSKHLVSTLIKTDCTAIGSNII